MDDFNYCVGLVIVAFIILIGFVVSKDYEFSNNCIKNGYHQTIVVGSSDKIWVK